MSEESKEGRPTLDSAHDAFEVGSRRLFLESVDGIDMRLQSRLTQARHAAVDAARSRRWWVPARAWAPGVAAAAAVLGAALWVALPAMYGAGADQPSLEDLDIVAAADGGAGDALEMLQNDLDFYDFADKAVNGAPSV